MILSNFSVLLGPLVCSKLVQGLERWLHSSEHWFLLQRTRVQYLVPTQWLTTIYIKLQFQGESDAFCGLHGDCTYCAQTYIQAEYATGEIKINKISRKKIEQKYVGRRGCEGSIWIRAYRWKYLCVFLSSFPTLCLSKVTGVWEGKHNPEGQRPLPPSVLHSGSTGTVSTGLWHAHLSSRAQLSWHLAAHSSSAGVWLSCLLSCPARTGC